jgi:hypothetical protein
MHGQMTPGTVAVLASLLAVPSASAQAPTGDSIQVEIQGQFSRTPDGQGLRIAASGVTWNVDLSADRKLGDAAGLLAGSRAIVRGTYAGPQKGARAGQVLKATAVQPAGDTGRRDSIDVTVRGTVNTGLMAIGGETTGTTITAGTVTWDLELTDAQRGIADKLDGRKAVVSGQLRRANGVELPDRFIVSVRRIEPR